MSVVNLARDGGSRAFREYWCCMGAVDVARIASDHNAFREYWCRMGVCGRGSGAGHG